MTFEIWELHEFVPINSYSVLPGTGEWYVLLKNGLAGISIFFKNISGWKFDDHRFGKT